MSKRFFARSAQAVLISSLAPALLLLCLGGGCQQSTLPPGPGGEPTKFKEKNGGLEIIHKDSEGKETRVNTGKHVALPENFPKDVPIYPKSTVDLSVILDKGMEVTWKTADPVQKVEAFYKERLKDGGWELKSMNMPQLIMIKGLKEYRTVTVSIRADSGKTIIAVNLGEAE